MSNQALIRKPFGISADLVSTMAEVMDLGELVAKSGMFPDITSQAKACMIILAGREIGVPSMAALRGMYVHKGKVEFHAGLLAALVKASAKYDYKVITSSDEICQIAWFENSAPVGESEFKIEHAKRAGLIKPDSNWAKFPKAMLFARALTSGQRTYAPDIAIGAAYAPGEMTETDVIDIAPAPVELFPTAKEIFDDSHPLSNTPLPEAWTADTPAREIADQEIANKIGAELKTIAAEVAAEAPAATQATTNRIAEAREKNIAPAKPNPDPVPALAPTLTAAQQKVSDAVMLLFKEHKQAKVDTLLVIEKFLGRPVKASKDLSDEDAEKVFAHLQTLASELSADTKPESPPVKYNRKTRGHNEQIAKAIDEAMKRLTILNVPFGPVLDSIAELVEREFGRRIANRYELNDEEAQSVLEYLQTRILEKECEVAVNADEV